ncbi:MAG: hypothetical protein WKF97_06660 [Chitinophagaceae bacterium]
MYKKDLHILFCFILTLNMSCIKSDGPLPPKETSSPTGNCLGTPGPLFTAVKNLVLQHCISCHNNNLASGAANFSVDCNIVLRKDRIKSRSVDEGSMPPNGPLSQTDKNKITAWINAGGQYAN